MSSSFPENVLFYFLNRLYQLFVVLMPKNSDFDKIWARLNGKVPRRNADINM